MKKPAPAKVAALESLLDREGHHHPQTVDKVLAYFESEMTPLNGKKIVVKAWTDPEFAARVVVDTPAAIAELDLPDGMAGAEGEHLQAVANTPGVHNLVICTLCSCFPWPVLGCRPTGTRIRCSAPGPPASRARCSREVGVDAARRHRDQGLGQQRTLAVVRHPRTSRRH